MIGEIVNRKNKNPTFDYGIKIIHFWVLFFLVEFIVGLGMPSSAHANEVTRVAPDFTVRSLDGTRDIKLSNYRGHVVYLDFWASWCGPCRKSMPVMELLSQRYADKGLVVLAVSVDEELQQAREFAGRWTLSYELAHSADGKVAEAYSLRGMPSSFVIDTDGRIIYQHLGFNNKDIEKIEAKLNSVLNK